MSESDDHCDQCGMTWTPPHEIWSAGPGIGPCPCGGKHSTGAENERSAHAQGRHNYRAYTKAQAHQRQ